MPRKMPTLNLGINLNSIQCSYLITKLYIILWTVSNGKGHSIKLPPKSLEING